MCSAMIHWEISSKNDLSAEASTVGKKKIAARTPRLIERNAYFLWRCRFSNLRCLCLRIFLRRFLITLPNGFLPCFVEPRS